MELKKARLIADGLVTRLRPWCKRLEIAGSIRREKPEVGDIEVVCIPRKIEGSFFGDLVYDPQFSRTVKNFGRHIKGDLDNDFKYAQIEIEHIYGKINLDLFVANIKNWGYIMGIRTGSSDFSKNILASGWVRAGYNGIGGMLTKAGRPVEVREEQDLFNLIGIPFVEPKDRI